MANWVEDHARIEALLYRDGPEVWRDLKASIRQAVEDYTRIYTPSGTIEVQFVDCARTTPNCIRARTVPPPQQSDTSYEISFNPETHKIGCAETGQEFSLQVKDDKIVILEGEKGVSAEDASRAFLKPLFDKLPRRRPNLNP